MEHLKSLHQDAIHLHSTIKSKKSDSFYSSGIKWVVTMALLGALKLVIGILAFLVSLSLTGFIIVLLFMGGWLLVLARFLFIWACEPLRDDASLIVGAIDIVIRILNLFMPIFTDGFDTTVNLINEDLNAIEKVFHVKQINVPVIPQYKSAADVSKAAFIKTFTQIPIVCTRYDTMPEVVIYFLRVVSHDLTCPAALIAYSSPSLYEDTETSLSWSYFGSAEPFPDVPFDNCNGYNNVTVYDTICATMGFGYVMIYLLTPMAIIFMLLVFTYSGLVDLFRAVMYYSYMVLRFLMTKLVFFLDTLFN